MRTAIVALPSEYFMNCDDAAGDAPCLNDDAARTLSQPRPKPPTQRSSEKLTRFLLPPSIAAAAAVSLHHGGLAAAPTTATVASPVEVKASAAAAAISRPTANEVESAIKDRMKLFISGASTGPTYALRGELGRGKYGRVFLVENCVQRRLLAVRATYDPNWSASVRHTRTRGQQQQQLTRQYVRRAGLDAASAAADVVSPLTGGPISAVSSPPTPPSTHISNEVACMLECSSPFIVRLEGVEKGEHGEDLLLMEYVDCGDLRHEIRRRRAIAHHFSETEVAFIFLQLCMAVDHLHQRNILHHDLKPENVMLSSTGVVKLGDFGFARKYPEPVCDRVAATGCGTPYYLSPEALRGERYSLESEMWALGVILYELMALVGPFVASNRNDLRRKVHEAEYAPLPPTYSQALRGVCVQLLSQNPDHRPSAHALFTENEYLRELLNELRRTSECSTKMTAEEKGSMFYSISAALRRRSHVAPGGVAAGFTGQQVKQRRL
ncbi:putative protein kinase [Leptomonas pyrrhocoris]|uniref:non-specific serine/threonine protein kinase n=1 Tax=Leptomonas pyrrhocoris TaxID=157538 RepID=A0A0N0DVD1_LEPPY|nr:putative protein kinase [Leptomonas pyrrhocoris]KPA80188.1 putative protein kinase [Leptomonas pyrrhocoris]|eukprot:XP_015658627.1 putative protein kinase [Leptomonas pyrrhocoris]